VRPTGAPVSRLSDGFDPDLSARAAGGSEALGDEEHEQRDARDPREHDHEPSAEQRDRSDALGPR